MASANARFPTDQRAEPGVVEFEPVPPEDEVLRPVISHVRERHPGVVVELSLSNRAADLRPSRDPPERLGLP